MQTEIIWKTTLKNGIYGSLTPPLADPFNPDHFYVADGWGSIVISGGENLIHFFEKQQFLLCVEADSDYKKLVGRSLQQ